MPDASLAEAGPAAAAGACASVIGMGSRRLPVAVLRPRLGLRALAARALIVPMPEKQHVAALTRRWKRWSPAVLALAVVTAGCARDYCGAPPGKAAAGAARGLGRDRETVAAMAILGLMWSPDPHKSDIFFLGYPDLGLSAVAGAMTTWDGDPTGLRHTYAEDGDGKDATCNGDLRRLVGGRPSELTAAALAADIDVVLALAEPSDVYTHVEFDGHPDHAEVHRQVTAAILRRGVSATLHGTLIHPEGTGQCMPLSADQWPNPPLTDNRPEARFTPALDVTAPPLPPCAAESSGMRWGPVGPPDELVEVPAAMQDASLERNLKWRVLTEYRSQLDCQKRSDGTYHASCGYLRAFVKRHEFFWVRRFGTPPADHAGPVLVVAAHPDDEALGFAGVIAAAKAARRRVFVAIVTNGD